MSSFQVDVHVFDEFDCLVSVKSLAQVVQETLAIEAPGDNVSVSVVVAGDDLVRDLNKSHRGLDENTDVLAFSFTHQGEYYGVRQPSLRDPRETDFVVPPGHGETLGEVIVSYPQAGRQAAESGHAVEKELALLVAHGVLHLLGHDHNEPKEEVAMRRLEAKVLGRVWGEA